jgi:hypothetical protein
MDHSGIRTCDHQVPSSLLGPLCYAVPGLVSGVSPITMIAEHISPERARRSFHTPLLATLTGRTKFAPGGGNERRKRLSSHRHETTITNNERKGKQAGYLAQASPGFPGRPKPYLVPGSKEKA